VSRVIETKVHQAPGGKPCRSAKQMTDLCCHDTAALQCCEMIVPWDGYNQGEMLDKLGIVLDSRGRDQQGRYVNIVRDQRSRPCGEQRTVYDLSPKVCCEDVPPLEWRDDVTPDVLPAGSSIIIAWDGSDGRENIVKTSSNATWFSDGRKYAIGYGNSIELFAGETFCGATSVSVNDGCSEAVMVIRSDHGQWVLRGSGCPIPGVPTTEYGSNSTGWAISGKYKVVETVSQLTWVSCVYCPVSSDDNYPACMAAPCAGKISSYMAAIRPASTAMDTCLRFNMVQVYTGRVQELHGTLGDGAIVIKDALFGCGFSCPAIPIEGSTGQTLGGSAKTSSISYYEWMC
jgi:hypothetical protein